MSEHDNTQASETAAQGAETRTNGTRPRPPDDPVGILMHELTQTRSELEEVNMRLASVQVQLVLCGLLIVLAATVAVKLARGHAD